MLFDDTWDHVFSGDAVVTFRYLLTSEYNALQSKLAEVDGLTRMLASMREAIVSVRGFETSAGPLVWPKDADQLMAIFGRAVHDQETAAMLKAFADHTYSKVVDANPTTP